MKRDDDCFLNIAITSAIEFHKLAAESERVFAALVLYHDYSGPQRCMPGADADAVLKLRAKATAQPPPHPPPAHLFVPAQKKAKRHEDDVPEAPATGPGVSSISSSGSFGTSKGGDDDKGGKGHSKGGKNAKGTDDVRDRVKATVKGGEGKGGRRPYTSDDLIELRAESDVAAQLGLRWQERGPPAPDDPYDTWRGQRFRPESGRWANRGGSMSQWFTEFYTTKKHHPERFAKWLKDNPKPSKSGEK